MTLASFVRRAVLAAGLALWLWAPLTAAADASNQIAPPLSLEDKALVDRAAAYLQGLGEVKGRFEQTDARGDVSRGDLYLNRPGRARFVYDPPSGLLVICDGYTVLVADPRLKTANRYPLGSTPLSLFLAKQVRLDKGVVVSAVDHFADSYALTAHDARHPAQGQITLVFSESPMRLREWRMTDAHGRTTQIRLTDLEAAPDLDPSLFLVPAPRPVRGNVNQF